ncbi:MAG: restriction endonuclease subunit S, partial [Bacteroidales bacterium]|nr:restriction endonuclease subunit S [Bacteroidales bacterium]
MSHYPKEVPFELPEGWAWSTLGELCTVFSAKRVHQSDWQKKGIPFYRAREIVKLSEQGYVANELFISEMLYNDFISTGLIPSPGDIMISAVGTIGRTYIVRATDRFYFKDASVLCLKNPYLIPAYLDLYLQSTLAKTQMHDGSKGTTVDTITIEKAVDYLIPIPPYAEQKRIVSYIDSTLPIFVSIESQKESIEDLIEKSKKRILDLAIHGKLVPQDPNEEPAIELLKRINPDFKPSDNLHYEGTLPVGWSLCRLEDILEYEQPQAYIVKSTD